jgi:adenylate cyclase
MQPTAISKRTRVIRFKRFIVIQDLAYYQILLLFRMVTLFPYNLLKKLLVFNSGTFFPGEIVNLMTMERELAILMADLTGYTAMTDVHGGESAARIVRKYMELVDRALCGNARLVQRVGDQVVIVSDSAYDAAATAIQLNELASKEERFLSVHAGIHYGPIFEENDDLFGSTINVASRIMNMADHGQILCSSALVSKIDDDSGFTFKAFGFHRLKNVLQEVEVLELYPTNRSSSHHVDPVCHMHVDPSKGDYTLTINNKTYHFCSAHCLDLFKLQPAAFI